MTRIPFFVAINGAGQELIHFFLAGSHCGISLSRGNFTVGGQIIVSPTPIDSAGPGLLLGEEVEVHAKGMKEPLRCRQLRGHEERPEWGLGEETACAPLPVQYVLLTGKHLDEQMEPAALLALSQRQAVLEARKPVPAYSNLLIRREPMSGDAEVPELYAKAIRPIDESGNRYLIHFTSIPPNLRVRLRRLLETQP